MRRVDKFFNHLEEYFGFASLLITSILIFVQVVLRYLFNYSLFWSEEVARYLIVWFIFIGGSIAVREKSHATVDLLSIYLKGIYKHLLAVIATIIAIVFFVLLMISGIETVKNVIVFSNVTPALGIPMYIPYLAIPVGSALMIYRFVQTLIRDLIELKAQIGNRDIREGES